MFVETLEETGKFEEALNIFKALRPEFQDYALQQIRNLSVLQEKCIPHT